MEIALQEACPVLDFDGRPNIDLEQYSTSPHLATQMVGFIEEEYRAIEGKVVGDFGCGCGVLTVACGLMEAEMVFGFDIDPRCVGLTWNHSQNVGMQGVELVQRDLAEGFPSRLLFDTVVMNPPFGTRRPGIDILFVERAVEVAEEVFSLHKTSTRRFIEKKDREMECEVVATLRFDLPKTYQMHKKKSVDVEVDLWRFAKRP